MKKGYAGSGRWPRFPHAGRHAGFHFTKFICSGFFPSAKSVPPYPTRRKISPGRREDIRCAVNGILSFPPLFANRRHCGGACSVSLWRDSEILREQAVASYPYHSPHGNVCGRYPGPVPLTQSEVKGESTLKGRNRRIVFCWESSDAGRGRRSRKPSSVRLCRNMSTKASRAQGRVQQCGRAVENRWR